MVGRKKSDKPFKYSSAAAASIAIGLVIIPAFILVVSAYPSFIVNGPAFFSTAVWRPALDSQVITVHGIQTLQGSTYGVLVYVVGTLISSAIALLLAIPTGLAIAIFLSQIAPSKIAAPISFAVELLAGIPSVIYGFWGFAVLGPFLFNVLEPLLADHLSFVPIFAGPVHNSGLLAAGIILALMVVPIIASISRDAMVRTPLQLKEGAKALGLTNWEVTRKVVLPYARTGIIGSAVLGLGRAIGETIAVAMIAGVGIEVIPTTLFYPVNTIAAFMALSLSTAFTDPSGMFVSALMEMGLLLLIITLAINVVARLLIRQSFTSSSDTVVRI